MLASSIARVIEHRRRRRGAAEWEIVAHIDPTSPGIIAMRSFGREDMRLNAPEDRFEHGAARPHLVAKVDRLSGTPSLA